MKRTRFILSVGLISSIVLSCKPDEVEPTPCETCEDQLRVTVQPTFDGNFLTLDSVYTTVEGYDVKFTDIKFFVEDVRGSAQIIDAALFDFRTNGTLLFQGLGTPADVTALTANLGVGAVNHDDPSAFPIESVLNTNNSSGMHWDWSPGYIFIKVEGKLDTIADGNPLFDHNIIFHVGKDINLQTLSFPNVSWQQLATKIYGCNLELNMSTFLQNAGQNIDLKTEYTSHTAPGQEALSLKVIENFKAALSEF
ncbi:MAG: hypothetical protein ACI865_002249 [Flavobacteriaceae bacterium]|jgi:hypothetical protein